MEHYDGPAFYRKYNIKHNAIEPTHANKSEQSSSHQTIDTPKESKHSVEDEILTRTENPIAKRAAAFTPTHNSSSATKVQFYEGSSSSKYQKLKEQLTRDNESLMLITDDSTDAINLSNPTIPVEVDLQEDKYAVDEEANEISQFNDIKADSYATPYIESMAKKDADINVASDIDESDNTNFESKANSSFDEFINRSTHQDESDEDFNNDIVQNNNDNIEENDDDIKDDLNNDDEGDSFASMNDDEEADDLYDNQQADSQSDDSLSQSVAARKPIEQHGLGNSLSSILNQEHNVQKDLSIFNDQTDKVEEESEYSHEESVSADYDDRGYRFPSMSLLSPADTFEDDSMDDWITSQAEILDETLQAFNVDASVVDWTNGPTVTQFQIKLQLGVKVSKITNLTDDLKLALAAKDIRIEAPIPGKTTVGIEIPNPKPRPVKLSEVINTPQFMNTDKPLTVALGVDLTGKPQMADLSKMPHGLIAGATGSGKSVFLNSLLISLLYKATPAQLKMILIDPKAVEMAPYDKLPHLLSPVISDPKQASAALKWSVKEMDERYEKLAAAGARNIEQFNEMAEKAGEYTKKMPYILIVIDELADLMMVASSEVQDYIVRITQKARAAGIHLIVATQRPSVDIITGTIKNNIPTRVAFMVSSQVDSRTIIDTAGAERLLGKGDMLYLGNGASQSSRLQGTFVTNDEIERITNEVRKQGQPKYAFQPESLLKSVNQVEQQDELMPDVLEYISSEETVSTSKLQRVFSIGYNRAASLIDDLEQHNYVSGQHGSKPRDVYLTESDYQKLNI
ncbi:DNA translocase FtsK [Apilactobacillus apinorum]|uniref:DNA translocase FtsK n=1 Tax=Apilactobacillus apinorum TaxID=1218495 RepID=A0ABP9ZJ46_9LACO